MHALTNRLTASNPSFSNRASSIESSTPKAAVPVVVLADRKPLTGEFDTQEITVLVQHVPQNKLAALIPASLRPSRNGKGWVSGVAASADALLGARFVFLVMTV